MKIFSSQSGFNQGGAGELPELVEGEKLGGSVVRRMNNGIYLINLKGRQVTASFDSELSENSRFRAQVIKAGPQVELKIINKFEDGFNSAAVKQSSTSVPTDENADAVFFRLLKGTITGAKEGDKITLNIVRSFSGGIKLLEAEGYLFKAELGDTIQSNLKAIVLKTDPFIELMVAKSPLENLDSLFLKTEIGKFDFAALLKSTGKFSGINFENLSAKDIKVAIKESGVFFENKLLNDEQVSGDEKFRANMQYDTPAKDAITRLQLINVLVADGLISYLKSQNDDVSDALVRYKQDEKGNNIMYISLEFSKIGKTLVKIRQVKDVFDIMIKTEVDISEQINDLKIENAFIRWASYNVSDEEIFAVKKLTAENLGGFDKTV